VSNPEISAEVAALKSGLGPFYGRILAALERIADALDSSGGSVATTVARRRLKDASDS